MRDEMMVGYQRIKDGKKKKKFKKQRNIEKNSKK
jgi:hypothetical protein